MPNQHWSLCYHHAVVAGNLHRSRVKLFIGIHIGVKEFKNLIV